MVALKPAGTGSHESSSISQLILEGFHVPVKENTPSMLSESIDDSLVKATMN